MIDHVLVPLDGSFESETILPHVRGLIRRGTREITLLQTLTPVAVGDGSILAGVGFEQVRAYLGGIKTGLARRHLHVRTLARLGYPAPTILGLAGEKDVSLIAMATHGRSGISRFVLGSVTSQVLRKSPVPVLAAHPMWSYELAPAIPREDQAVRTLLVPVDGTETSRAAIPVAIRWARLHQAEVIVLRLLDGPPGELPKEEDPVSRFLHDGVPVTLVSSAGEAVEAIAEACRSLEVDGIVLSLEGPNTIARWLHGGLQERLLRRVPVPLLVVSRAMASASRPVPAGVEAHRH